MLQAADRGKCVFLVLLDLSAAFDTISHDIILKRLTLKFGVNGIAWQWIKSYLANRSQSVLVSGKYSVCMAQVRYPIRISTGPYSLFGLYFSCYGFADDTQLHTSVDPSEEASALERLEHCIEDLCHWMNKNRLKLKVSKIEFIIFGTPHILKQSAPNQ